MQGLPMLNVQKLTHHVKEVWWKIWISPWNNMCLWESCMQNNWSNGTIFVYFQWHLKVEEVKVDTSNYMKSSNRQIWALEA